MKSEITNTNFQIRASLLVRNTTLNVISQVIPLLIAIVSIPFIIHGLGVDRFGILTLAGVLLGYFNLLDFGLGRATTKFVSTALGKGETRQIPPIVWTSLLIVTLISSLGVVLLLILTPVLVERILNIPPGLVEEAKVVFYITSASFFIALTTATLSGVLEAYQRFDLVNAPKIPSNILTYIIPATGVLFGTGLPAIVLALSVKNAIVLLIYLYYCIRLVRSIKSGTAIDLTIVPSLFHFGKWIALYNAAFAVLLYLDRFLVSILLTVSAVTYYATPYELVNKALIIPSSMMMVLFPAFSSLENMDKERLQSIFIRALKYIILLMGLIIGITFVFSQEILTLWLGSEFALKATAVLRLLAIGGFLNSIAWLCGTLLQALEKARTVTIIHLLPAPIYVIGTWWLIKTMDIEGAALSWTIRALISLILLLFACWKIGIFKVRYMVQTGSLQLTIIFVTLSIITIFIKSQMPYSAIYVSFELTLFLITSMIITWKYALDPKDRSLMINTLTSLRLANK